jgi:hypothetical protein
MILCNDINPVAHVNGPNRCQNPLRSYAADTLNNNSPKTGIFHAPDWPMALKHSHIDINLHYFFLICLIALPSDLRASTAGSPFPAIGNWSSEQVSASVQLCVSQGIYDNIEDRNRVSMQALFFTCGCVVGHATKRKSYVDLYLVSKVI